MKNSQEKFNFENLFILDLANNHKGSLELGRKIVSEFAKVIKAEGVRAAIKFQLRDLETLIHPDHREHSEFPYIGYFQKNSLKADDYNVLAEDIRSNGMITMATPFDERSVDLLAELGIEIIKVASASAADWPLLEKIASTGKPVVCSTGGLKINEVDNLVSFFEHRNVHFALLHCVAIYPTPQEKLNLGQIAEFKRRYPEITIGFSTHEDPNNLEAVKVAYALGARIFERHIGIETADAKLNAYSSTPEQIRAWIRARYQAVSMAALPTAQDEETETLSQFQRGVYAGRALPAGTQILPADVTFAIPLLPGQLASGQLKGAYTDRDYLPGEPISAQAKSNTLSKKQIIYKAIHDVKGMLRMARVKINYDSNVELSHHRGLEQFTEVGAFIIDCINREYCKKIIVLLPGQTHPAHYHQKKEETFQLLSGRLVVSLEDREKIIEPGDTLLVPRGVRHSFHTSEGAILEEISTTHLNDDSFYDEQSIQEKPREERKTKLVNWGRHQFDDLEDGLERLRTGNRKAVIFDMDGVLIDSEPLKFQAYQKVFANEFGVQIEDDPGRLGKHEPVVMDMYLKKHNLSGNVPKLIENKRRIYYEMLKDKNTELTGGAEELLERLKKSGFILGLATSSDKKSMDIILDRWGLRRYFEAVLSQEDVEHKKPAPDIYLKAALLLNTNPADCMVIEDTNVGIEAASRAGMKSYLAAGSFAELDANKINLLFAGEKND